MEIIFISNFFYQEHSDEILTIVLIINSLNFLVLTIPNIFHWKLHTDTNIVNFMY